MGSPKKASKTKKAIAVAMVCSGAVVAAPRPAAAEPVHAPLDNVRDALDRVARKVPGNFKYTDIVLKRMLPQRPANPR